MPEISPSKYLVQVDRSSRNSHWHDGARSKACVRCGDTKALTDFYAYPYVTNQGKRSTRYESRCKECAKARRKERSAAIPGLDARYAQQWRDKNPDQVVAYRRSEETKRNKARHQRLRNARIRAGLTGPEVEERIKQVYQQAAEMQALFGVEFHVDHIIPLARGGQHVPENLQVMLARENRKKGASCPK